MSLHCRCIPRRPGLSSSDALRRSAVSDAGLASRRPSTSASPSSAARAVRVNSKFNGEPGDCGEREVTRVATATQLEPFNSWHHPDVSGCPSHRLGRCRQGVHAAPRKRGNRFRRSGAWWQPFPPARVRRRVQGRTAWSGDLTASRPQYIRTQQYYAPHRRML